MTPLKKISIQSKALSIELTTVNKKKGSRFDILFKEHPNNKIYASEKKCIAFSKIIIIINNIETTDMLVHKIRDSLITLKIRQHINDKRSSLSN